MWLVISALNSVDNSVLPLKQSSVEQHMVYFPQLSTIFLKWYGILGGLFSRNRFIIIFQKLIAVFGQPCLGIVCNRSTVFRTMLPRLLQIMVSPGSS